MLNPAFIEKTIYRFNLSGATDVSSYTGTVGTTGKTVDQLTTTETVLNAIRPIDKGLHVDLNAAGDNTVQKVEGLTVIDENTLAVINDNDFGVVGITIQPDGTFSLNPDYVPEPVVLGIIHVGRNNRVDASDRDGIPVLDPNDPKKTLTTGKINIRQWPVKGIYMPDAIASYCVGRNEYLITANEGDAREYIDLVTDPVTGKVTEVPSFVEAVRPAFALRRHGSPWGSGPSTNTQPNIHNALVDSPHGDCNLVSPSRFPRSPFRFFRPMIARPKLTSRRILTGTIAAATFSTGAWAQTDGSWNVNNGGAWSNAANWLNNTIADGATATASFDFDITGDRSVTLDTSRTLGNLVFRDTDAGTNGWTLGASNASVLTLDNGASQPTVSVYPRSTGFIAQINAPIAGTNGFSVEAPIGTASLAFGTAANTFSGVLNVGSGVTLRVGNGGSLGVADVQGTLTPVDFTEIQGGASLNINGVNLGTEYIKVQGAGVGGIGAIFNSGGGQNNALQQVEMTGDTTFGGSGRWDIRAPGPAVGRLYQNGFTLTKTGTNQMSLVNVEVVGDGDIVVNQGVLAIEAGSIVEGSGEITLNTGTSLNFWDNVGSFTRQIVANGGAINHTNSTTATIAAPIRLQATTDIQQVDGGTLNLNGNITESGGSFGINKINTGTLNLGGDNTFTGAINMPGGTLNLLGSNDAAGGLFITGGTVTSDGALGADAGITVSNNSFLTLNGPTNAAGGLTVTNGNVVSAGTLGADAGITIVNGDVTLDGATTAVGGVVLTDGTLTSNDALGANAGMAITNGTFTSNNVLGADGGITITNSDVTLNGATNAAGGIVLRSGTLDVNAATQATNGTTVESGTLTLGSGGSLASSVIAIGDGAEIDVSAAAGGYTLNNGQTLAAGHSGAPRTDVTGALNFNAGSTLQVGAMGSAQTMSVSGNVSLTDARLALDLNTTAAGPNDLVAVGGNLSLSGTNTVVINPFGGGLSASSYLIATYAGTLTGGAPNLTFTGLPTGTRQMFAFNTGTQGEILFVVSGAAADLVWAGGANANAWDVNTTANWLNGATPDTFRNLDNVTFNDAGSNSPAVAITGSVNAGTITVNAAQDYTFGGTGTLDGGAIVKSGNGTLTITNSNHTYSGGVQINGGAISVATLGNAGGPSSLGSKPAIGIDGGMLTFTGATESSSHGLAIGSNGGMVNITGGSSTLTLSGAISGSGDLTKSGPGTLVLSGAGSQTGAIAINAGALKVDYSVADPTAAASGIVVSPGTSLDLVHNDGSFNVAADISGSGPVTIDPHVTGAAAPATVMLGGDNSGYSGALNLDPTSGTFRTGPVGQAGLGTSTVTVNSGAQLWLAPGASVNNEITLTGTGYVESDGTASGAARIDDATLAGPIHVVGSAKISANNSTGTVAGAIDGGDLVLGGSNSGLPTTIVLTGNVTTSSVTVNGGSTGGGATTVIVGDGGTTGNIAGPITLTGDTMVGAIGFNRSDSYALSGPIASVGANQGNTAIQVDVQGTGFSTNGNAITIGGDFNVGTIVPDAVATIDSATSVRNVNVGLLNPASPTTNATLNLVAGANVTAANITVAQGAGGQPDGSTDGAKVNIGAGTTVSIASNFFIGDLPGSAGAVTQTGGDVTVGNEFRLGHWPNNASTYDISAGTLTLTGTPAQFPYQTVNPWETAGVLYLGIDGAGTLNQTGGTVTAPAVVADNRGDTPFGISAYNLDAGELVLTGSFGMISRNPSGQFNFNGGTLVAGADTAIDSNAVLINVATTFNTNGHDISLYGNLNGTSEITISGNGSLTMRDGAVGAGNVVGGNQPGGSVGSNDVTVAAGSSLVFDRATSDSWLGVVSGAGALVKSNVGSLTLVGGSTLTAPIAINGGAIVNEGGISGSVSVNNGGALSGTGNTGATTVAPGGGLRPGAAAEDGAIGTLTVSSLTMNGGDLRVDIATDGMSNDLLSVTGTANYAAASTITPAFTELPVAGTYVVVTAGTLNATVPPTVGNTGSRYVFSIDTTTQPNNILLTVSGSSKSLTWTGETDGTWDVNTTTNWSDGANPEKFFNFDAVTFGDAGINRDLTIAAGGVTPASLTVNAAAGIDYSLSGPGMLLGGTGISKSGEGTLVINNSNANTGPTEITGGTLRIATNQNPVGTNDSINVSNGGTFDVGGQIGTTASVRYNLTVEGNGAPGQAAIWNSGAGVVNDPIYQSITLSGNASIGGVNRYDLNVAGNQGVDFNGGSFTLTKVGPNETWWAPNAGATVGDIVVDEGFFGVQSSENLGDLDTSIIVNETGNLVTYSNITNSKPIVLNGGLLAANFEFGTWFGTVTLNGPGTTNRIGILAGSGGGGVLLSGKVTGAGGFEMVNGGELALQSLENDWQGETLVSAGTLRTEFGGILSPNTTLNLNGGIVDINFSPQTVAGLRGTSGMIQGSDTLSVVQTANTTFDGTIEGFTSLRKAGAGRLTLGGVSPTTGTFTIDEGQLVVNGSVAGSMVAVNANGTLAGNGTVGITDVKGGLVTPGDGIGTLTLAGLSLDGNAKLRLELVDPDTVGGGVNDLLTINGNLTLDGVLEIITRAGFDGGTYRIADYTGTLTNNTLELDPAFAALYPGSFIDANVPGQINLIVIPEPGSLATLASGLVALLGLRRVRTRQE